MNRNLPRISTSRHVATLHHCNIAFSQLQIVYIVRDTYDGQTIRKVQQHIGSDGGQAQAVFEANTCRRCPVPQKPERINSAGYERADTLKSTDAVPSVPDFASPQPGYPNSPLLLCIVLLVQLTTATDNTVVAWLQDDTDCGV